MVKPKKKTCHKNTSPVHPIATIQYFFFKITKKVMPAEKLESFFNYNIKK